MSFVQFFRILWARRAITLIALLGCLLAATLVTRIMPERYDAKSRVMLDIVKPDPITGEVMGSQFARAFVKTQIELIRDYRVVGKVVDNFGWTSNAQLAARYADRPSSDKRDFRRWLAQIVINNMSVSLIEGSNILEITYSAGNADIARKGADAIRQAYVEQTLGFRREAAQRNADWFKVQTAKVREKLAQAEKRKSDFEKANGIILQDDNSDTDSARLKSLASTPLPTAAGGAGFTSPSAAQLAQIDGAIASASQTLGPNHPDLQNLRRQRIAVAAAAGRERAASAGGGSGPSISSLVSAQTAKVLAQRGKVNEAQRLAADITILRDQFSKTAARAAALQQEAESTETGLTLLGNAVAPDEPAFPNIPLIIFGSIALGTALGILTSLVVELLSRRVRGVEDLSLPGIPVIGSMGSSNVAGRPQSFLGWLGFDRTLAG